MDFLSMEKKTIARKEEPNMKQRLTGTGKPLVR